MIKIGPNFEDILLRNARGPNLVLRPWGLGEPFDGIVIPPMLVNYVVPTVGLGRRDGETALIFISDTYISDHISEVARGSKYLKAVFVDAAAFKHLTPLTPRTLASDLSKLGRRVEVYATYLKSGGRVGYVS